MGLVKFLGEFSILGDLEKNNQQTVHLLPSPKPRNILFVSLTLFFLGHSGIRFFVRCSNLMTLHLFLSENNQNTCIRTFDMNGSCCAIIFLIWEIISLAPECGKNLLDFRDTFYKKPEAKMWCENDIKNTLIHFETSNGLIFTKLWCWTNLYFLIKKSILVIFRNRFYKKLEPPRPKNYTL